MGFVERMKWWQWVVVSLLLGGFLAYVNSGVADTSVDHGSVSTVVFETDLISRPWVDPKDSNNRKSWMSDIVVHPVHEVMVGGQPIKSQLVSFSQFTAPTPSHPSGEASLQYLLAPFPYEPTPRGRARRNVAYPAASLYYGKAGDTLNSLTMRFYHKDTLEGEKAIVSANQDLREAKGAGDLRIVTDKAYWIPWNPAEGHTISDFLVAADKFVHQQQGSSALPISFHYHWWESTKYGYQIWIAGSFLIVGVIWPTLLMVLVRGGLGRTNPDEYDLSRFGKGSKSVGPVPVTVTSPSESEMQKLRDLEASMTESVKGFAISAPAVEVVAEPETEIKKLSGGVLETTALPKGDEQPKAYTGEYYPVVKSPGSAEEKK